MANLNIYPPIIDSTLPAFISGGSLNIPITLSRFSTTPRINIRGIHVSIKEAISGASVVDTSHAPSNNRYYNAGLIVIDVNKEFENSNSTIIEIDSSEVKWKPGTLYTIQIRLSNIEYGGDDSLGGLSNWLTANMDNFSEWSIICRTTAIGKPRLRIKRFGDKDINGLLDEVDEIYTISASRFSFEGLYSNIVESSDPNNKVETQTNENLYSYKLSLYAGGGDTPLEVSDVIIPQIRNTFDYTFDYQIENNSEYMVLLEYETINAFKGSIKFHFNVVFSIIDKTNVFAVTLDNLDYLKSNYTDYEDFIEDFNKKTNLDMEQETGRIGIKLFEAGGLPHIGNICLLRADSKDNFRNWIEIKIIPFNTEIINNYPIIYDYTIESGVFYKYAVCTILTNGEKGIMNPSDHRRISPSLREFEYSYLIGKNGRTLKLKFNNSMSSYTTNKVDVKTDTIGSVYPFISRIANVGYKTFPFSALVSFTMDAEKLFLKEEDLYDSAVVELYKDRRKVEDIHLYDYKREYDFREEVIKFLQDGEPKLFKSSTEGNIIVRLMGVSAQPTQSLNRMISAVSATAHEIADNNYDNYIKYGFTTVGEYSTSFEKVITKIGQLIIDANHGDNIITKIVEKYDRSEKNIAGQEFILRNIKDLRFSFEDAPIRYKGKKPGSYLLGNKFNYSIGTSASSEFIVRAEYGRIYQFDSSINITKKDSIIIDNMDADGVAQTSHIVIDFIYEIVQKPYKAKEIESRTTQQGVGQFFGSCNAGDDIYRSLYYKYYYEWELKFRRLSQLSWTCIEANPGTVIRLKDSLDTEGELHDINFTGVLNLEGLGNILDIGYVGMRLADGSIDPVPADIMVDYSYINIEGIYKAEEDE